MVFFPPLVLAQSQANTEFPQRTVKLVVPFPAGGATDVMARLVAQKLTELWTQPVVIENRAGATGAVGSVFVAKAAPDGYTILMGTGTTHAVSPATNPNIPYSLRDFAPISLVASFPNLLVVHPSLPVKTVPELISYLKQNPNRVNFSSTGNGGSVHLAAELFKQATKTDMVHIPYKGSAEALNDLMSGQVQLTFDNFSTVWPLVQTGKLRALGVASLERSPSAPDVPAIAETLPGFEANTWVGLFAPAGTPSAIVQKISNDVQAVLKDAAVSKKFVSMGAIPNGNQPDIFTAFVLKDTQRWKNVVTSAGIKID
ncbi:MAG: tripartite tricarboxylate transporter substrate binding protein [Betaproteobacteria bacterium]|nr:tripartite tricarboxylate transporter substrate binding protein [Betaproteobacteria bacterium]